MRHVHGFVGAVAIVVGVWAAAASGCVFSPGYDDCNQYPHPGCGTGGGSSSSTTTSSSTTGTGGMPPSCIPHESADPVADSCGVFVSSSLGVDDKAADRGTKAKPFKSIGAALLKADAARVYACAESFTEAVTIASTVDLYGGLDCKSWVYVGATSKTALTAPADAVPLTLSGNAKVEDFAITAADAAMDGGSSIAVVAEQKTASFARCDLVAGTGKAGLAGTTPTDPVGPTDSNDIAIKGNDGAMACASMSKNDGGLTKENLLCPAGLGGPVGGSGGDGLLISGNDGQKGQPAGAGGQQGVGQPASDPMNLWSCIAGQGAAGSGSNGAPGTDGAGAAGASSLGTVGKSGYIGAPGEPGGLAPPGQGGGGGGGAKGKAVCAGASGGGGGAGGCGGKGGLGGKAGGASIALVSLGATLSFEKVTITAGVGGDGGNGGDGQGGGKGGNGGNGGSGDVTAPATLDACNGGKGGQGGTGGKGGGGRGGHAIGIAYTGATAPSTKGATFPTPGKPGKGGAGAADMMHDGDPGVAADVQVFP